VRVTWEVNDERAFVRRLWVMEPKEDRVDLVAGRSLDRVRLGSTPDEVRAVLGESDRVTGNGSAVAWYYPTAIVGYGDGTVTALVAIAPSDHTTPDGVRVGTSLAELRALVDDDLVFDEDESLWYSPGTPGLWYDVGPPYGDSPPDPPHVRSAGPELDEDAVVRRLFVMRPKAEL
jgi:hypothetical protein